jgi:phosphoribosyl 1,2-cyclic phosphodiesterase
MAVYYSSLNSGSNGNCYYIGNEQDAVLIDAGISCRETERRMSRSGLDPAKLRAVFISHEHTDHIKGADVLSRRFGIPVYLTETTHRYSRLQLVPELLRYFDANHPVAVGSLKVKAFTKNHDAADPHSFIVSSDGITVGVMTDIGSACDQLSRHFRRCHAAFLEANYDEEMLENGHYPAHLKARIRGKNGHLSNDQALAFFLKHRTAQMQHLLLSHLSQENNDPERVVQLFHPHVRSIRFGIASRHAESEVFVLGADVKPVSKSIRETPGGEQLRLF